MLLLVVLDFQSPVPDSFLAAAHLAIGLPGKLQEEGRMPPPHGLGTSLTGFHLYFEQEAAEVLGILYEQVMQAALIPVAYTLGTDFKPALRKSLEEVAHWDRW